MVDEQKKDLKRYALATVLTGFSLFAMVIYGLIRFYQIGQYDLFLLYFTSVGLMWMVMSLDRICTNLEEKIDGKNHDEHGSS